MSGTTLKGPRSRIFGSVTMIPHSINGEDAAPQQVPGRRRRGTFGARGDARRGAQYLGFGRRTLLGFY